MSSSPSVPAQTLITDRSRGLTGPVVTILVGPAENPFSIHRDLLTSKSTFFNAALAGTWAESTTGIVHLRDDDPELFSLYGRWIYGWEWTKDGNGEELRFEACCRMYVLADKLGSETLQNLAVDKLREYALRSQEDGQVCLNVATISFVYGATTSRSGLRKLVADMLAWQMSVPSFKGLIDAAPECLYDALRVCKRRINRLPKDQKGSRPYRDKGAFCESYHVHHDGSTCSLPGNPGTGEGESKA